MSRIALSFANASCAHCVRVVTRSLAALDGVRMVEVDRPASRVVVEFDPQYVTVESIRGAMETSGYPTRLLQPNGHPAEQSGVAARAA